MSMDIMNHYGNYANSSKEAGKADRCERDANGILTSTVELKTSKPNVTRREQIKTGFKTVNDYSKYLQGKYGYMNIGITSMQGIPTTVTVSPAFLEKCNKDPEKAKFLEENLAAIPDCAKYAESHSSGTLTSLSYQFDANGNITIISSSTSDPDGKIAKENAERKAKESREAEKKALEKRAAQKAEKEKAEKKRADKKLAKEQIEEAEDRELTISAVGNSVVSITRSVVSALSQNAEAAAGFDVKA